MNAKACIVLPPALLWAVFARLTAIGDASRAAVVDTLSVGWSRSSP
jgi:hypothetical protein